MARTGTCTACTMAARPSRPSSRATFAFDSLGQTYQSFRKGSLFASTALVLRYRPGLRPDTVAELLAKQTKALQANRNGTGTYQEVLFSPEDAWTVAPDGWVAVARAEPYHVEWIPPTGLSIVGLAIQRGCRGNSIDRTTQISNSITVQF